MDRGVDSARELSKQKSARWNRSKRISVLTGYDVPLQLYNNTLNSSVTWRRSNLLSPRLPCRNFTFSLFIHAFVFQSRDFYRRLIISLKQNRSFVTSRWILTNNVFFLYRKKCFICCSVHFMDTIFDILWDIWYLVRNCSIAGFYLWECLCGGCCDICI